MGHRSEAWLGVSSWELSHRRYPHATLRGGPKDGTGGQESKIKPLLITIHAIHDFLPANGHQALFQVPGPVWRLKHFKNLLQSLGHNSTSAFVGPRTWVRFQRVIPVLGRQK